MRNSDPDYSDEFFKMHAAGRKPLEEVLRAASAVPAEWQTKSTRQVLGFLRLRSNMAQRELAERAGVRQSSIAKAESGQDLRISTLRKLFAAMGYDLLILPLKRKTPEPAPGPVNIPKE